MSKFRAGAPIRPWLYKITANVCLDALRKRKERIVPLDGLIEGQNQLQVRRKDELPEEAYLSRETRLDVQIALTRLPVDYRVVLILRYLHDLSYREVADVLGVPVSTVETRIFRAKKMLGHILRPSEVDEKEGTRHELHLERRASL